MPVGFLSWTLLTKEKTGVADSRRKVMNSILILLSLFSVSQAQYVKCNTRGKSIGISGEKNTYSLLLEFFMYILQIAFQNTNEY